MLTRPPLDRQTRVHPFEFFDHRSHFFRLRQLIDGDWLIRQYFGRLLEEECGYANDEIKAELKGLTDLTPLYWDKETKSFRPHVREPVPEPVPVGQAAVATQTRVVLLDPVAPLERLDQAGATTVDHPRLVDGINDAFRYDGRFYCTIRNQAIKAGCWNALAFISPSNVRRLGDALGPQQARGEFDKAEWLLRHAFANKNVRRNSALASTLSRVPFLFAKADSAGEVRFDFNGIPKGGHYGIPGNHWLVGILDTEAYLQKRH